MRQLRALLSDRDVTTKIHHSNPVLFHNLFFLSQTAINRYDCAMDHGEPEDGDDDAEDIMEGQCF